MKLPNFCIHTISSDAAMAGQFETATDHLATYGDVAQPLLDRLNAIRKESETYISYQRIQAARMGIADGVIAGEYMRMMADVMTIWDRARDSGVLLGETMPNGVVFDFFHEVSSSFNREAISGYGAVVQIEEENGDRVDIFVVPGIGVTHCLVRLTPAVKPDIDLDDEDGCDVSYTFPEGNGDAAVTLVTRNGVK